MTQEFHFNLKTPIGFVWVSGDQNAVHRIELLDERGPQSKTLSLVLQKAKKQIQEYFKGERLVFDVPVALNGTDFQNKVWKALQRIPCGQTKSYGDIARGIKNDKACRAVGLANNKNKIPLLVPCHRVVGANGDLTGFACGLWRKEWLLNHEQKIAQKQSLRKTA
ncbi:MAG: methylated-DNA--[protein]-cysteine S-methyltransferase [Deltaproteobacteria bacterium]|nr:methylated-DNA--[protein]-cysteine S-methyltransferase [Deltaproteobacteria bacterium]